jgi:uncharacterized protein
MNVSELRVYPLKGAAGIRLDRFGLDAFGPRHDRRWMIVDAGGGFVTQRNHRRLALLGTALEDDALVLRSTAAGSIRLPIDGPGDDAPPVRVCVWADEVDARDAGPAAAAFVSAHLGVAARLLYMPDSTLRQADLDFARPGDRVSFADGFPLLVISQASLDELNRRVPEPLPMIRFRPNIVIGGADRPHAEDAWRSIRVGSVICDVVKPCARCTVTTVDPLTADAGREPLRTLAGYRRWNGQVWFGQNAVHRTEGTLAVGDAVEVLASAEPRPPLPFPPPLTPHDSRESVAPT